MGSVLAEISLLRAGLPEVPGSTVPEMLLNAQQQARTILLKYVPNLEFSYSEAEKAVSRINVWQEQNETELQSIMLDQNIETLPDAIQKQFGSDALQAYILYGYTEATRGLGPWLSGAVAKAAASGQKVNDRWAREDATARLATFSSIIKMEQDGFLASVFTPPSSTFGYGIAEIPAVIVWGIVVAVVVVAALIISYLYLSKTVEVNNRLMSDLCKEAQLKGDNETVQKCIQATAELQKAPNVTGSLVTVAIVLGLAYIAVTQLPGVLGRTKARRLEELPLR